MQGSVYLCKSIETDKVYAAKTFNIGSDEEIRNQISAEYNILKNLAHHGILKVYDMLDQESNPTIIMEYFEG